MVKWRAEPLIESPLLLALYDAENSYSPGDATTTRAMRLT